MGRCESVWGGRHEAAAVQASQALISRRLLTSVLAGWLHFTMPLGSTPQEQVFCKYVRRELRNLLPEDREAFFNVRAASSIEGQPLLRRATRAMLLLHTSSRVGDGLCGPAMRLLPDR